MFAIIWTKLVSKVFIVSIETCVYKQMLWLGFDVNFIDFIEFEFNF